jgi:lipopolysaccharide export system permease protein
MKLIDRYIINELLAPFLSGILAFTIILLGSTVLFDLIGSAVKYGIPFTTVFFIIILKLPLVIGIAIPMSTLFATISVFGRLGNDLEILALRANGISIARLLIPVFFVGLFISLTSLFFSEKIIPSSSSMAKNLILSHKHNNQPKVQNNINITEYKNNLPYRIINIGEKEGLNFKNITIAEYEDGNLERLIRSKKGKWIQKGGWIFFDGIMHIFQSSNKDKISIIKFKKEYINIAINPIDIENRNKATEEMNQKELKEKIDFLIKTGEDPIKLIMDLHMKNAIAFSSLIYCFLGASMGLKPHRSSSAMGIGLSLIVIFIYIILMAIGSALGLSKTIPPIIAAWFPNIIIGSVSIYLVKRLASN